VQRGRSCELCFDRHQLLSRSDPQPPLSSLDHSHSRPKLALVPNQVFPDGRERRRGLPLCEKLLAGEEWAVGMRRGIHEELASVLSPDSRITLDDASLRVVHEESYSQSYPDLLTRCDSPSLRGRLGLRGTERCGK
jgi:hypothetical protein